MYKNLILGTAFATLLMGAGTAMAEPATFSKIDVQADVGSVDTQRAMKFWPTMAEDIRAEVAKGLVDQTSEKGYEVRIAVRNVAVNSKASDATFDDLNALDTVVSVWDAETQQPVDSFVVNLSAVPSDMESTAQVIVLQPGDKDLYHALISALGVEINTHLDALKM